MPKNQEEQSLEEMLKGLKPMPSQQPPEPESKQPIKNKKKGKNEFLLAGFAALTSAAVLAYSTVIYFESSKFSKYLAVVMAVPTQTPTLTYTPSPTPTDTPTMTSVPPTFTFTPTSTLTSTFTHSPTKTYTPVPTNTFTPTSTSTNTLTPTYTNTFTPKPSDTVTPTPTITKTPTPNEAQIRKEKLSQIDNLFINYRGEYDAIIKDGKINKEERLMLDSLEKYVSILVDEYEKVDREYLQILTASKLLEDIDIWKIKYDEEQLIIEKRAKYNEFKAAGDQAMPGFFTFADKDIYSAYQNARTWYRKAESVAPSDRESAAMEKKLNQLDNKIKGMEEFFERQRRWESRPRRAFSGTHD